jgi:hypothetical protein
MSANFTEIFSDLRLFTPLSLEKVEEKKKTLLLNITAPPCPPNPKNVTIYPAT